MASNRVITYIKAGLVKACGSTKKMWLVFLLAIVVVSAVVFSYHALRNDGSTCEYPNVLLLTIDALRADHLGCYGYQLKTSPNIDKLAQRGVRFADCTVQWPKTWPSMASLITGAYPKTTGMRIEQCMLPSSFCVLSKIFGQAGYRTGAVVANFNIGRTFGFDLGFDHFVESWQDRWNEVARGVPFHNQPGKVKMFTDATIVTNQALKWLRESNSKKPFFLWLHYMEPHGPYVPPPPYGSYFVGKYKSKLVALEKLPPYQLQKDLETGEIITDIGFYLAQYDGEIRYLDDELARLFAEVSKLCSDRNTVIILTADHGESLGEHDYYLEHGGFSYQACAHVPLIIVKDGELPEGKTIEEPVGLIDVSATILELVGIEVPASFEGKSLVGLMHDETNATAPKYVFMESGSYTDRPQLTVRHGRWKLIHVTSLLDQVNMAGTEYELYNVTDDPAEVHNFVDELPHLVTRLSKILHEWYTTGPRYNEEGTKIDIESLDPKAVEMLRSLGYVK